MRNRKFNNQLYPHIIINIIDPEKFHNAFDKHGLPFTCDSISPITKEISLLEYNNLAEGLKKCSHKLTCIAARFCQSSFKLEPLTNDDGYIFYESDAHKKYLNENPNEKPYYLLKTTGAVNTKRQVQKKIKGNSINTSLFFPNATQGKKRKHACIELKPESKYFFDGHELITYIAKLK